MLWLDKHGEWCITVGINMVYVWWVMLGSGTVAAKADLYQYYVPVSLMSLFYTLL